MSYMPKVREFVSSEFVTDILSDEIPDDLDLIESGIVDSLGILKIIAFLEEEYGINIHMEEMEADRYRSLSAINSFIAAKRDAALVDA